MKNQTYLYYQLKCIFYISRISFKVYVIYVVQNLKWDEYQLATRDCKGINTSRSNIYETISEITINSITV